MNRRVLPSRTRPGIELEKALADWITASRRAYESTNEPRDEQAEDAAWRRVQSVLAAADAPTAA